MERLKAKLLKHPNVTLVAVSKTKPISDIINLYNDGQRDFGENYIQELVEKAEQLPSDIRWHFIGSLQSNKVKLLASVKNLHAVHTIDSVKKCDLLDKHANEKVQVYVQVNTSHEESKGGLADNEEDVYNLAQHIASSCKMLDFKGLMTIGSPDNTTKPNPDFARLSELKKYLESRGFPSVGMSMGMSDDFEEAIDAGSTCVRVGSLLFGKRTQPFTSLNKLTLMQFLIYFRQFHPEFRIPEFKSVLKLLKIEAKYDENLYSNDNPFFIVAFDSTNDAQKVASRSILIRSIHLLISSGQTHEETRTLLSQRLEMMDQFNQLDKSWKFTVDRFKFVSNSSTPLMKFYSEIFTPIGAVDLKTPNVEYTIIEDHSSGSLDHVYFGILIARGDDASCKKLDLKKRSYLGTTSMDAQLSLIMANQALCKPGVLVYDPFVGTGSFLYSCSHYGAITMGSDLDGRQMRGLTKHKNVGVGIASNIEQYGLANRVLESIVCDHARHPFLRKPLFDAIVADPPYGVRAGAKKIKSNENKESLSNSKFPETELYDMEDVVIDLVNFAAVHLVIGGRLVFWLPTVTQEFSVQDLPSHPWMRLVSNSSQNFGSWERRLITLEKIAHGESARVEKSEGKPAHAHFRMKYFSAFGR